MGYSAEFFVGIKGTKRAEGIFEGKFLTFLLQILAAQSVFAGIRLSHTEGSFTKRRLVG